MATPDAPTSNAHGLFVIATALLLPLLGACFADPTCTHECEGSVITKCDWECTGDGKLDLDECHREYTREDCAQRMGPSGGPMTCKLEHVEGSPPVPTCIDANMPRCDPTTSGFCTGPHLGQFHWER